MCKENIRKKILEFGLMFPDTYQDAPFHDENWQLVRYKGNNKAFLWTYERNGYININLKCSPLRGAFLREYYKSVLPAYHQNKEHWITVVLDGNIPNKEIKIMISESYNLISDSPTKHIYDAVKKIPYGKVATYGQIALMCGDKNMSRSVGNALHKNKDPKVIPCYRVVNSKGKLTNSFAFGGIYGQRKLLEEEGVEVIDGKVDLSRFQWK